MTDTATKERPILFSGPMVRAILSAEKTQTRRVVNLKHVLSPEQKRLGFEQCDDPSKFRASTLVKGVPRLTVPTRHPDDRDVPWDDCGGECLYATYETGGRLWVRETWADVNSECGPSLIYKADGAVRTWQDFSTSFGPDYGAGPSMDYDVYPGSYVMWWSDLLRGEPGHRWKPSIHMPRWASRITLEITDVRVERLQEISLDDCLAEGILATDHWRQCRGATIDGHGVDAGWEQFGREVFRDLWDSINRARGFGWYLNPWVWVIEFKRLEADHAE